MKTMVDFEKPSVDEAFKHYWELLDLRQKKSVLEMVKTFVDEEEVDEAFLTEYNKDIDEALKQYERGETYTHEEAVLILNERRLNYGKNKMD